MAMNIGNIVLSCVSNSWSPWRPLDGHLPLSQDRGNQQGD